MKKVAVLGSTGMIGSGVVMSFAGSSCEFTEFNRSGISIKPNNRAELFEIRKETFSTIESKLSNFDYLLNFIGSIRHKIDENSVDSIETAFITNTQFPIFLDSLATRNGFRVIQIGTDCVFSGSTGNYSELSLHDPFDIYGISKSLGESSFKSTLNLRTSVVGQERSSHLELMDWVTRQPVNASIDGYQNHVWSGCTPLQIGRLIGAVIENDLFSPGTQHLVPGNKVSKYELVALIAKLAGRFDLKINQVDAPIKIDRSLSTIYPEVNLRLWSAAGYVQPPSVQDMIREYQDWKDGPRL